MTEFISTREMRAIEENTYFLGQEPKILMEIAGKSLADFVMETYPDAKKICILCGMGNNGGDGVVAAKYLAAWNKTITIVLVGKKNKFNTSYAQDNFRYVSKLNAVKVMFFSDITQEL